MSANGVPLLPLLLLVLSDAAFFPLDVSLGVQPRTSADWCASKVLPDVLDAELSTPVAGVRRFVVDDDPAQLVESRSGAGSRRPKSSPNTSPNTCKVKQFESLTKSTHRASTNYVVAFDFNAEY